MREFIEREIENEEVLISDQDAVNGASELSLTDIAHYKKQAFLKAFLEDDFRDKVVRPLFERKGFTFLRHTCGHDEEGKDCLFEAFDRFERRQIYAVQTKRGDLNMSSKARENIVIAKTQVKMALDTDVVVGGGREKTRPYEVILCASGSMNTAARNFIFDGNRDSRLTFLDANDLIPLIDQYYPEFWNGIDAQKYPYLQRLRQELLSHSDTIAVSAIDGNNYAPIADDNYVTLFLVRYTLKYQKRDGHAETVPSLKQISEIQLVKQTNEKLVIIVGEGGSGKTTALRRIAYRQAKEVVEGRSQQLPVVLKAIEIIRSGLNLLQVAEDTTAQICRNGKPSFTVDDLSSGNVLMLIDAIDELANDQSRESLLLLIREFHELYPKCQIVVTSRDYAYIRTMPLLKAFSRYDLSPFSMKQANQIVERYSQGRSLSKTNAKETLRRLSEIHGVSLNPMMVTVFVSTSDMSRKDIPPNIAEIFKKFTEQMLGRWDEKKGMAQQYQSNVKDFLLQKMAFQMHNELTTRMSLLRCRSMISRELEQMGYEADVQTLFEEIVYRSGLLRIEEEDILFRHHLFQEFLLVEAYQAVNSL